MDGAFEWLNKIFQYFWQFVPRPYLITWVNRGVRYRRGKPPILVKPGVRWYWPLTTEVKVINVTLQAQEFHATVYTTRDGKSFSLGYTLVFTVSDPVIADSSTDNYVQTIGELAESILSPIVASHTFLELLEMIAKSPRRGSLDAILSRKTRTAMKTYGINVTYCRVNTFSVTCVLDLHQDQRQS
ncbi:MAG: hypothetical protein A2746_02415 [Candidatus Yanofskybacteria bacterium RIFCSPHIGHO2_01_FULL_44_22]|uniref:Band 7 domain-containing protein n=1 Tax=Candidatus Yanofskybacteria bacterium RIFCSPHIGHO2_01_FULL_44_22 TaxID=1802669 RepID=A0A1F8F0X4_9BACT|nr:MAG: hypothetical protein A2746_02415 [Candidatus Yanofskybacteria bacterium RIFCSPHIGHO2_01_FULL_44_22]